MGKYSINIVRGTYKEWLAKLVILGFLFINSGVSISCVSYLGGDALEKEVFFRPVIERLLNRGTSPDFIYTILNSPDVKFNEKFAKINVTGYLNKADYSQFYNQLSIEKTRKFIISHLAILNRAEDKYNVPKEVIASILWIETRHGGFLGSSNIAGVFLSTAMCNEPEFLKLNKDAIRANADISPDDYPKMDSTVEARSRKKVNWAIEQLIALEKMQKTSPKSITEIRGSWAGAFGMSQFLPSSYVRWAVDGNNDGKKELFDVEDAVFSVGNYLKSNGWGNSEESRRKAVFHYNNSNDYVTAVLTLAEKSRYIPLETLPLHEQMELLNN